MKRKAIVEELNKKNLVRSDVAVTDELKEILKPYLYCKYRNGWVIKNAHIITGIEGIEVKMSQFDERIIEKIKTFEHHQ